MEKNTVVHNTLPKTAWNNLSQAEKAEIIKVAVKNNITDLKTIRQKYNEFAEEGNIYDGTTMPTQQMQTDATYVSTPIAPIYSPAYQLPEVTVRPDSNLSPAERVLAERARKQAHDRTFGKGSYNAYRRQEQTDYLIDKAARPTNADKALDYAQALFSGIGQGADIASMTMGGLPIYSALKGAKALNEKDYVDGAMWMTPILGIAGKRGIVMTKEAIDTSTNPKMQYVRYGIGKIKGALKGKVPELPTLYRKIGTVPTVKNGKMQLTPVENRFAFEKGFGEESPIITNMSSDAPVRPHSTTSWNKYPTLAFPGETLLGKNVVSTRPSDTFTYGETLLVPVKKVKVLSGRPKELSISAKNGISTITSKNAQELWQVGKEDLFPKIAKIREQIQKYNAAKARGEITLIPKRPDERFGDYAKEIESLTRKYLKSPTIEDYQFMDYVFNPKYKSQTTPVVQDFNRDFLTNNSETFGQWYGNDTRRRYLSDKSYWKNVMYDPATAAEENFRLKLGIDLKPQYKK